MNRLMLMVCVVDREDGERCVSIQGAQGAALVLMSAGSGTASHEMLRMLGLDETEKDIIFSIVKSGMAGSILQKLINRLKMVAFTVPVSSVVSALTFKEYAAEAPPVPIENRGETEGEKCMVSHHSAVVVIVNRGYMDLVMDAARKGGATGGTLIHAKGASTHAKEKFFGVSFAEEKEMIFIVTDNERRPQIMKEIVHEAGIHTKAKAMVFSLPVNELAGFTGLSSDDMD